MSTAHNRQGMSQPRCPREMNEENVLCTQWSFSHKKQQYGSTCRKMGGIREHHLDEISQLTQTNVFSHIWNQNTDTHTH